MMKRNNRKKKKTVMASCFSDPGGLSSMDFARHELKLLARNMSDPDLEMQERINDVVLNILSMVYVDGCTYSVAASALDMAKRLISYRPLTPLLGTPDEWGDPIPRKEGSKWNIYMNKRCPQVTMAKNVDTDEIKYTYDSKYQFSGDGGITWFLSCQLAKELGLDMNIKFPFMPYSPEKVYIKVGRGGWPNGDVKIITGNQEEIEACRLKHIIAESGA